MSVILECPVCEARFELEKIPVRIDCPACKTNFKTPLANPEAPVEAGSTTPSSLAQAPRRLQSAPSVGPPVFPSTSLSGNAVSRSQLSNQPTPTEAEVPSVDCGIQVDAGKGVAAAYPLRPKKNIWVTLTSLLLAIVAIGGLFAIITVLGQPGDTEAQTKNETGNPAVDADGEKNPLDKAVAKTKRAKPELPPVDETPEFFKPRQMEIVWNRVNGYMVKLEVRTPIRTRNVSGLIVDSRGWVVTSLSALQDAGEVQVTLAGKNLDDDPPFRQLVDLSRGIIAEDPVHDLALISINRAQVINLADIKLDQTDNVVEASRFLIARTPPPRHRRWLAECRIATRRKFPQLSPDVKQELEAANLQTDANVKWLVYPPRLPTNLARELAGSPLIDEQGTVVAINTGVQTRDNAIAVPAIVVQELINSVNGGATDVKPFGRAADLVRQASGDVEPEMVEAKNSFDDIIRRLLEDVDACRKTDWSADNETEFASMQSMSKNLNDAYDWVAQNLHRVEDPEKHDELLKTAVEEMTMSLEDDLVRQDFLEGKGNEFFFTMVNQENPWFVLAVKVVKDQFNSPQVLDQETVVFEVLGTGKHVIAAAGPDARSFREGRRFLLIGGLSDRGLFNSGMFAGESSINLVNVHAHIQIGLRSRK